MNEVVTVRPSTLSIAPLFQSSVSESPSNIFKQTVMNQSADLRRMSFVWRSPGANLLMNPSAYISFQVVVNVPHNISKAYNIAAIVQRQNIVAPAAAGAGTFAGSDVASLQTASGPALAFGSGNCVMNAIESLQYVVNGGSISHSNWNLFKRTLDSCQIPAKVAQRCFSQAGGSWLRFDEKCVSTSQSSGRGTSDTATHSDGTQSAGMTIDSGLSLRLRNFSDAVVGEAFPVDSAGARAANYAKGIELTIRVQAPLDGGVFNQVSGEAGMARSSSYQALCLAIPNCNSMAVTMLFKDLEKQLIRRLGRTWSPVASDASVANSASAEDTPFSVKYDTSYQARLHIEYIRLQSFRRYPEAVSLATYRHQTYITDMPGTAVPNQLVKNAVYSPGYSGVYLLPSGPDAMDNTHSCAYLAQDSSRSWTCNHANIQFAQPPSYLLFCAQKLTDCMTHEQGRVVNGDNGTCEFKLDFTAETAGALGDVEGTALSAAKKRKVLAFHKNIAQNQDSNLSITRFKLLIQSSVGTFQMSSDKFPFLQDQRELFQVHKRNCCQSYLEDSGIAEWSSRCSCLLLSSSEYMHGLGTSAGTSFPIQITAEIIYQNRCTFVTGLQYSDFRAAGPILHRDYIGARGVCVGIFDKQVLQIASSSSVLSAQNFTQSTTASLLAGRS